jgi:formamidase
MVKLAAISGNPKKPKAPVDCLDFYTDRLDTLAGERVDLVCLPELINSTGLEGDSAGWAEPIPGPTSERLAEKARDYGMYVAASLLEQQGDGVYNTGLLIDRTGGILGKYRKTHVTLAEGLLRGTAPGDVYPVFQMDFGSVGYMICYDGHYPEVPRTLGLQGAEVILHSNMGDGREGGRLWESVVRTRAVDNQVHLVAALNRGKTCIVSPNGEFLAEGDGTPGAVVVANCDLNASMCDFSKRPIHRRYDQLRRADTFGELTRHLWDSV